MCHGMIFDDDAMPSEVKDGGTGTSISTDLSSEFASLVDDVDILCVNCVVDEAVKHVF